MKLFVGSLPFSISDQELQDLFAPYGAVASAKIILDRETQRSRGFGFVEFSSKEEGAEAMKALDNTEVGGRTIVVKEANDRPARR